MLIETLPHVFIGIIALAMSIKVVIDVLLDISTARSEEEGRSEAVLKTDALGNDKNSSTPRNKGKCA
jgi:hypothetical protein